MKLRITFDYLAPLAERYTVIDDSEYDGAPDAGAQLVGNGATEEAAKADFMDQWLEREAERDLKNAAKHMQFWDSFFSKLLGT
jgi:hypothetical protein